MARFNVMEKINTGNAKDLIERLRTLYNRTANQIEACGCIMYARSTYRMEDLLEEYFGKDSSVLEDMKAFMVKTFGGMILEVPPEDCPCGVFEFFRDHACLHCTWDPARGYINNSGVEISTTKYLLDVNALGIR